MEEMDLYNCKKNINKAWLNFKFSHSSELFVSLGISCIVWNMKLYMWSCYNLRWEQISDQFFVRFESF